MNTRFSISVSRDIAQFVEAYQQKNDVKSRSEVIERGLKLLREKELQQAYYEAGQEWLVSEDAALWENTSADGLADKAG